MPNFPIFFYACINVFRENPPLCFLQLHSFSQAETCPPNKITFMYFVLNNRVHFFFFKTCPPDIIISVCFCSENHIFFENHIDLLFFVKHVYTVWVYQMFEMFEMFDIWCFLSQTETCPQNKITNFFFFKEPYKRDDTLQERPMILGSLRIDFSEWHLSAK